MRRENEGKKEEGSMNDILQKFARDKLKEWLPKCTPAEQLVFKRMYSPKDVTLPIETVVDNMPWENLDWAMTQVERTFLKMGGE